jgi:hypothetical protein
MVLSGISSIMVQVGEPVWTSAALHLACAIARTRCYELILVKLIPVSHVGWLGTDFGNQNLTEADRKLMQDCCATAEDYGVLFSTGLYQYVTLSEALVDAAQDFDAQIVIASLPPYKLPFWRRFLTWRMRRQLTKQRRLLYTLDRSHSNELPLPQILVPATPQDVI